MPRKRKVPKEDVIKRAMTLYWKHGYSQIPMDKLSKQIDVNLFSIYSLFDSKDDLFNHTVDLYIDLEIKPKLKLIEGKDSDLKNIQDYLLAVATSYSTAETNRGCFLNNSISELSHKSDFIKEKADNYFTTLTALFKNAINNAKEKDQLSKDIHTDTFANYLFGILTSLSHYSKFSNEDELLQTYIKTALTNQTKTLVAA